MIFYRIKPSTLRTVQGVMDSPSVDPPSIHCESESDLETLIDGSLNGVRTSPLVIRNLLTLTLLDSCVEFERACRTTCEQVELQP